MTWAAANPFEIDFGVGNKDSAFQVSPNLVGFQQVLQYIAIQAQKQSIIRLTWFVIDKREYLARHREVGQAYRGVLGRNFPAMTMALVTGLIEDEGC